MSAKPMEATLYWLSSGGTLESSVAPTAAACRAGCDATQLARASSTDSKPALIAKETARMLFRQPIRVWLLDVEGLFWLARQLTGGAKHPLRALIGSRDPDHRNPLQGILRKLTRPA